MKFSIVTVSFNPGEKLRETVDSVLTQTYRDYEIIIKDGGSKDGSLSALAADPLVSAEVQEDRIRLVSEPDKGIYDAMNRAVKECHGDYILFLNCGDVFHDETVLEKVAAEMDKLSAKRIPMIFYGDTFCRSTGARVPSAPQITGFTCYRNIPCHQSCFYAKQLFERKQYDLEYRIRADYDHFLWCFYEGGAGFKHMPLVVADYEGGGYSESPANRMRDREEHEQITKQYMSTAELNKYRALLALTLAPIRKGLAESKVFSGVYEGAKSLLYRRK